MSKKQEISARTAPNRKAMSSPLQSTLQTAIVNMYNTLKNEDREEGIERSDTAIITRITTLTGRGFNSVNKVITDFKKGAELITPGKRRKRDRPVTGIDSFSKEAIARFIYDKLHKGEVVTAAKILAHMNENYDTYLYKGSKTSLQRILKDMGFVWSKGDPFAYIRETEVICFKRSCFLREYMQNKDSENPKPVVFLDETWIFMNGSPTYSWNKPQKSGHDVQGVIRRPTSEGGRLVIVHAGTKEGFVPGAGLIFSTNLKRNQDYHGAMNSEKFQTWVETQLIVGLRTIGPCVIVMDNASYHCKLVEQQPTTNWRKDQLVSWLRQNGVSPPENATKAELQRLCHMNRSHLKRYVVDEMLRNEGHTVLRLPPYHSFFNAIELVWSVAKQYYNKTVASRPGHGLDRARAVWKESLDQVTADIWRNEVKHAEQKIVEFYNNEVRDVPEVEELVIHHGSSESEEEEVGEEQEEGRTEEAEEELAVKLLLDDSVSADIKLETETEDGGVGEDVPSNLTPNMYHPRRALRNAINEWLPEFRRAKAAWGPIAKPQQLVAAAVPIPIIPSVNTCMSVTTTTTSCSSGSIPVVNANQLQALAEVCSSVTGTNDSLLQPTPGAVMNSLISETKVVCNEPISNGEPMDCNSTPPQTSPAHHAAKGVSTPITAEDVPMAEGGPSMQTENAGTMIVEPNTTDRSDRDLTHEDLALLCDLFYLPFEHGGQGLQLLQEFNWLKSNAHLVTLKNHKSSPDSSPDKPEVVEWFERATKLEDMTKALNSMFQRLTFCANRELLYDLYPYVWDMRGVVSLLNSYVKWLGFSKGWKETFMSGEQEPWVFRGGLTADLQRLIPVDSGNDLFIYKPPDVPSSRIYTIRPYLLQDESQVYDVCRRTCLDGMDGTDSNPELPNLAGDRLVGGFLTLSPEFCFVVEEETELTGYALAALDAKQFYKKLELGWLPEMCNKYPQPTKPVGDPLTVSEEFVSWFHTFRADVPEVIHSHHPSVMCCSLLNSVMDQSVAKRLVTCLLAALRANGSFGVYVPVSSKDRYVLEFYGKLGFLELSPGLSSDITYLGRVF